MRPVNDRNATLRTPLNDILGYGGNVRLLRCLVQVQHSMSYSELADRTGLSLPGVHKAVPRLIKTGIIRHSGSGKQQQVELRTAHPLSNSITQLFKSEKAYFNTLLEGLKRQIKQLVSQPTSAWIFGNAAKGVDKYGDAIQIAILGSLKTIDDQVEQLKDQLYNASFESKHDVTLDIRGLTKADLESRPALMEDIILLWGVDPRDLLGKQNYQGNKQILHEAVDAQSLENAAIWAKLLRIYPEIVQRTIKYVENQISETDSGEKKEWEEWKQILEGMPYQRLKKFLESDSERATRLRQSLPFWQVLNDTERRKLAELKSDQLQSHE